ncbi:MAG: M55 family metallopeptidase [bacterium]|nr:M55 family metallopeptidase [bacterium]
MKVYIQTDIEGISGFISFEDIHTQTVENFYHRQRMYRLLTGEVNSAVKGAKQAGADTIYINDSHGSGYNIIFEELEPGCEVIHGRGSHFPEWLTDLAGSDVLVLIGMHAMAGELDAVCPHTKWVVESKEGIIYLSEASMAMALAGDLGIPAVFISGDQVVTEEVKKKNPDIFTAVVKHSYGPNCCRSLVPKVVHKMISEGVKKGIEKRDKIKPYIIRGPLTINLLTSPGYIPPLKPSLKTPVKGKNITEAFNSILKKFTWASFGKKEMDWYMYPTNLSGKKPPDRK